MDPTTQILKWVAIISWIILILICLFLVVGIWLYRVLIP
jgi:hypothetical protein